jgi:hypothetical protein
MPKRSGKFYSKNEKQTLRSLGLKPAPASGAGWVVKEDGENETLMVQLKSTDALSYRITRLDMKKLEFHAEVSNKVPVFLVQFLKDDKLYAIVDVNNIDDLFYGLKGIRPNSSIINNNILYNNTDLSVYSSVDKSTSEYPSISVNRKEIKTSKSSRDKFFLEQEKKFRKK